MMFEAVWLEISSDVPADIAFGSFFQWGGASLGRPEVSVTFAKFES